MGHLEVGKIMSYTIRQSIKSAIVPFPGLARIYQRTLGRGRIPQGGYSVENLKQAMPEWVEAATILRQRAPTEHGKSLLLVGYLRWWLDHVSALGLLLSASGHSVELGFLPFGRWSVKIHPVDVRRQAALIEDALKPAEGLMAITDLSIPQPTNVDPEWFDQVHAQCLFDLQYTLQKEAIDIDGRPIDRELYQIRKERNLAVTRSILGMLRRKTYDAIVIPNGSILEFGMIFRIAKALEIPATTYDFGEQRSRIWLTQNGEVMRQDTGPLWAERGQDSLNVHEETALEKLYSARKEGKAWENFARRWQSGQRQNAPELRNELGLDPSKPVVLLCTNVVGDSLALGRQIFTEGMAEWLEITVRHFADREDVQLVVRVHPGELLGAGYPSTEIVLGALPSLPEHIVLVPPDSAVNTYDLISLASMGLVYTTTVGLEMVMSGLPVIVSGQTHYRGKGFTYDPATREEYLEMIANPHLAVPDESQLETAKHYAYVFFFEYPFPYPWHLIGFWDELSKLPFSAVATPEGLAPYERTLNALTGGGVDWAWGNMKKAEGAKLV